MIPKLVEVLEHDLERPSVEHGREVVGLVRDQIAERDPDAGDRGLVERDQRVPERDEQEQFREAEQMVPEAIVAQHHSDAMPSDENRRESKKERISKTQKLWLVSRQELGDRLLDACD